MGIYSQLSNYAVAHSGAPPLKTIRSIDRKYELRQLPHFKLPEGATEVNGGYYTGVVCMHP